MKNDFVGAVDRFGIYAKALQDSEVVDEASGLTSHDVLLLWSELQRMTAQQMEADPVAAAERHVP